MKISTEINSTARYVGEEKAIEYIAAAGFDAWDFSMFAMCRYDWGKDIILQRHIPHLLRALFEKLFRKSLRRDILSQTVLLQRILMKHF